MNFETLNPFNGQFFLYHNSSSTKMLNQGVISTGKDMFKPIGGGPNAKKYNMPNPVTGIQHLNNSASNAASSLNPLNSLNPMTWLSARSKQLIKADALLCVGLVGFGFGVLIFVTAKKGTTVNATIQSGVKTVGKLGLLA